MMNGKKKKQRSENMGSNLSNVKLTDNTKLIKNATDQQIEAALEAIGLKVEGYAKLLCPVKTGRLKNSITFATVNYHSPGNSDIKAGETPAEPQEYAMKAKPQKNTLYLGTNVKYAEAIECGTSNPKRRPKPYLKPAATQHTDEYKAIAEYYLTH